MKYLLIFFLLPFTLFATSPHSGKEEMNGIAFKDYKNFLQDWTLVTIRFRKDTGEMRMTYANKIAMETLANGESDYKKGAALAKTGIATSPDKSFTSSIVPRFIRRYQVMVYDPLKYSKTNGWGYALFDPSGKTFPEDPIETQESCHACHTIVADQGHVFSKPFDFRGKTRFIQFGPKTKSQLHFQETETKALPPKLRAILAKHPKASRLVFELLSQKIFQGALEELKPILEEEVLLKKRPAYFHSADFQRFVAVTPAEVKECAFDSGVAIHMTMLDGKVSQESVCLHD
jgi:hypothetical protein